MRLRDENASAYGSIFILSGLRPGVLANIPTAFHRLVTAPDARSARRRWRESPGRDPYLTIDEAALAVGANVHHAEAGLSDSELFGLHHRLGFDRLPANVVIAGDRLSVKTWHAEFDGATMLDFLHRLVDLACGLPDTPFAKPTVLPVLRGAIRAGGPLAVQEALEFRRQHITPVQPAPEPTRAQHRREAVALLRSTIDGRTVERLRRTGGQASVNSKLIALVAESAAVAYRDDGDPVVLTPVHLVRWVGGRVAGNFGFNLRLVGLRSTLWRPEAVQELISRMQGRAGFGGFLWDLQWPLKARLRGRSAEQAVRGELTVQVSAVRSPRPFPPEAWITGRPQVAFGSVGPYPAFFTLLWRIGDDVLVAIEDETGQFDTARYLREFDRRLAAYIGAREPVLTRSVARAA